MGRIASGDVRFWSPDCRVCDLHPDAGIAGLDHQDLRLGSGEGQLDALLTIGLVSLVGLVLWGVRQAGKKRRTELAEVFPNDYP